MPPTKTTPTYMESKVVPYGDLFYFIFALFLSGFVFFRRLTYLYGKKKVVLVVNKGFLIRFF
jgi:hypothetical protein